MSNLTNLTSTDALHTQLDAHRATQEVLFNWGLPGTGKTASVRDYAEKRDLPLRVLLLAQLEPSEVGGLPYLDRSAKTVQSDYALPQWFHELLEWEDGVLFLDELNAAPWTVQAAALTFIQDRELRGVKLPDGILICGAGNPVGAGISAMPLSPPMANRLSHFSFMPSVDDYLAGFRTAWGQEIGGVEKMNRAVMAAFLKSHRDLLHVMPETDEDQGLAWPSHRSWDKAVRLMSQLTEQRDQINALTSRVGEAAAAQYSVFAEGFRLPEDPAEIFSPGIDWENVDSAYASAVLLMMLNYLAEKKDPKLYEMAGDILVQISALPDKFDIAAFAAPEYVILKGKIKDAKLHAQVIKTFPAQIRAALGK